MNLGQTRAHFGADPEARTVHAQRREQVLAQVRSKAHAARRLEHLPGPVDADAVFPARARIEGQRNLQRDVAPRARARQVLHLGVASDVRVPDVVDETRGVREQVPERHRRPGRTQARLAFIVPAVEHLHFAEVGDHFAGGRVEIEPALLDELHHPRADQRLGHRSDPAHRVQVHRRPLAEHPLAEGGFVERALARGGGGDHARHIARGDGVAQQRIGVAAQRGRVGARGRCAAGNSARSEHSGAGLEERSAVDLHAKGNPLRYFT